MTESYEQLRAALRDRTVFVHLDVLPPRDAPPRQIMAYAFVPKPGDVPPTRPNGQAATLAITADQARELLAAGATWNGPPHLRAEILPDA
jgi:hypothetical protein|nr:hypothetical protein [Kofleriaceae bacterium]